MTVSVRFLQLAAAVCLCGQPFFLAVIWRPALARGVRSSLGHDTVERRVRTATLLAAATLVLAAAAELLRAPGGLDTAAGRQLVWRMAMASVIAACRPWQQPGLGRTAIWGVGSLALLATFSLTGHAAAMLPTSPGPLVAHLVHVCATGLWYGGLVCFLWLPWRNLPGEAQQTLAEAVNRFSQLGLLAMTGIGISGLLLADRYVYGIRVLTEHPYGGTLLVKLGFVGGVLALAAANRWWVQPRLGGARRFGADPVRWLRRFMTGEIVLGLAVLLLAVRLAATAPPQAEPVRLTVTLAPGPADMVMLEVPPLQPVRLTIHNPGGPPAGIYIPQIPGGSDTQGRAGDLQVMVAPGASRAVTFQAPAAGQYVIYYVGREGLRPAGWLLIRPR